MVTDKDRELKPCPCCGGRAKIQAGKQYKIMIQDWHDEEEEIHQPFSVRCVACGLSITRAACNAESGGQQGAQKEAKRLAIEAWNTRAESAEQALKEAADRAVQYVSGNIMDFDGSYYTDDGLRAAILGSAPEAPHA